jgi:hypothetical protein
MKRIKNFFFFEDTIDRVFLYLRDFKKTDSLFSDIRSATVITKGLNTFENGNQFFYLVNDNKIEFEVLEYNEDDKTKSIKWSLQVKDTTIRYEYEYILNKCTVGGNMILEWNLLFKENTKLESAQIINENNECMNRIKNKLKTDLKDYHISEACVIKEDRNAIKRIITSLDTIKNSFNIFGKVKYSGSPMTSGSKMICELPFMGVELKFLIDVVDFDESKYEWKYSFKSKPSTLGYNSYIKEILFTIINILPEKNFLEIKHTFNQKVSLDKLNSIRELQLDLLSKIKNNFKIT